MYYLFEKDRDRQGQRAREIVHPWFTPQMAHLALDVVPVSF